MRVEVRFITPGAKGSHYKADGKYITAEERNAGPIARKKAPKHDLRAQSKERGAAGQIQIMFKKFTSG